MKTLPITDAQTGSGTDKAVAQMQWHRQAVAKMQIPRFPACRPSTVDDSSSFSCVLTHGAVKLPAPAQSSELSVCDDEYAKDLINRLVESVGKMAKDRKDDGAR